MSVRYLRSMLVTSLAKESAEPGGPPITKKINHRATSSTATGPVA